MTDQKNKEERSIINISNERGTSSQVPLSTKFMPYACSIEAGPDKHFSFSNQKC